MILAVLSGALLVAGQQTQSFATQSSASQGLNIGVVPAMVSNCASFQEDLCRIAKGCSYCRSKWGQGNCYDDSTVPMLPAGADSLRRGRPCPLLVPADPHRRVARFSRSDRGLEKGAPLEGLACRCCILAHVLLIGWNTVCTQHVCTLYHD